MHAWLCKTPTGAQDLAWTELPAPAPGPGELLIEIEAASLNFPDLLIVQNKYQFKPELPFVPGCEYAGIVRVVGNGVSGYSPGDRAACYAGTGGFATHAVAPVEKCLRMPSDCDPAEAAAFVMAYATSHHALMDRAALKAGETVLVLGGAGGVGSSAIQIARAAGARVIAAASTSAKCAYCVKLGAHAAINYASQDLRAELKALTDGRGPDVIYDPVGGPYAEPAFRSIAWRGRYLVVGFAAGAIGALPMNLPLLKGASVVGVFWGDHARREPEANARMLDELVGMLRTGALKPPIDHVMPMAQLKAAYARMDARKVMGKLIVRNE